MNEVLKRLECENCQVFPELGSKIYICPQCQKYKCEKHFLQYKVCKNAYHPMQLDSNLTEAFLSVENFIAKLNFKPQVSEVKKSYNCSHSKNGCQEEFLAQKAHEKACIFQKVGCPYIDCEESVIFKDMDVHLAKTHKIEKVNDEWNFEGTKDKLDKFVCSLTSTRYDQQFFCMMFVKDDYLHFKVVTLGRLENIVHFKACFTFFYDNGQQISKEEAVYSITDKGKKYQFSKESMKKLTEYYDLKSMELKQQEKIKLTLKITNAKIDEIAKEKDVQRSVISLWKAPSDVIQPSARTTVCGPKVNISLQWPPK